MKEDSFFLTYDVLEKAVENAKSMVKSLEKKGDFKKGEFGVYIIITKKKRFSFLNSNFQYESFKKADLAFREKKDVVDIVNKTPSRLVKGDIVWLGGIYSQELKIAIGVDGLDSEEINDKVARYLLKQIETICIIEAKQEIKKLKARGAVFLS